MPTTVERLQVEVTASVSGAISDLNRVEREVTNLAARMSSFGVSAGAMARGTAGMGAASAGIWQDANGRYRTAAGQFSTAAAYQAQFARSTAGMGSVVNNTWNTVNNNITRTQQNVRRLTGLMGQIGGVAVVGGLAKAVGMTMEYDKTIRMVGVQTKATGDDLKALGDVAKQMGADTIYSANEAAQAMLELAKGGLTQAQIRSGALETSLTLAAAGGLELADASNAIVNGMGAFGLGAKEASRVTTALAGAANASSADVSDLTQSLAAGAAAANTAGLSVEETAAAFAIFANQGVKGSDAGTSLKTMMLSLVPSTDKARDAMQKYNLEFVDQEGNFKSLANISQQLQDRIGGLSKAQQVSALKTIFGNDAFRAASFLMDEGRKGVQKYTRATSDQQAAQDLANVAMSGASGAWENFTGAVETAAISLTEKFLPNITSTLNAGTDLVSNAKGWGDDFREYFGWMGESATDLVSALKPVGSVVAAVGGFINDLPGPVKEVGVQVGIAAFLFPRLAASVTATGTAFMVAGTRVLGFAAALRASGTAAQTAAIGRLGSAARTAAGIGGMVLLTQAMSATTEAGGAMMGALGGAALGFSMGGPLGAAIGGVAGGLIGLNSVQQETLDLTTGLSGATERYTDTLDANTGAITRATRAKAFDLLNSDKATSAAMRTASQYGISTRDIVSATLGNRGAQARLGEELARLDTRYNRLQAQGRELPKGQRDLRDALIQVTDAAASQRQTLGADLLAAREKARATQNWGEALAGIPPEVRTEIKEGGFRETRKSINDLVKEYDLIPEQKRTLYAAFGFDKARGDLAAMTADWQKVPAVIRNLGIGDAAAGVAVSTSEIGANLATLKRNFSDTQLRVFIRATGSDTTVREVRKSREAFRTLPENVTTAIYALGGNATRADIRRVAKEAGVTDGRRVRLMFAAIGVKPTRADLKNIGVDLTDVGKKRPNLQPWKAGLSDAIRGGRQQVRTGTGDIGDILRGGPIKTAKPNLSGFLGALSSGLSTGKSTASTGSTQIGANLKSGFSAGFAGADGLWSGQVRSAVSAAIAAGRAEAQIKSPSRKTAYLGRMLAEGLRVGMKGKRKAIVREAKELMRELVQGYKTGGNDLDRVLRQVRKIGLKAGGKRSDRRLIAGIKAENKALEGLYDRRAALAKRFAQAQTLLENRRQAKASFVDTTYQGMYQQANVLNAGNNAGTIASSLQAQVAKVKEFASLIKRLKKMGYRDDIVSQIAQAGVEGGITAARALAAASGTEQASINQSYAAIANTAKTTADALGGTLYDAGIRAAEGLVAGLKKKRKAVEDTIMDMAMAMQKAIKKALGIKSPSRVMASLGGMTAQGLVNGLVAREGDVAKAGARLGRAVTSVPPPPIRLPDTMGTRPPAAGPAAFGDPGRAGLSFTFHTYYPVAEPQSRTTNKALDKVANLGLA